jgi:hypothetical protein
MRRGLVVGLLMSAGLVAVALVVLFGRTGPVSPARFAQIRVGMTAAEVAAILGGPPGYYNDRDIAPVVTDGAVYELIKAGEPKEWRGNRWWILVFFDDQGRVRGKSLNPCIAWPDTFWGRINSWLGSPVF